jgi:hypothetical protein
MRYFYCTDPKCDFVLTTQVKGAFEASHRHGKSSKRYQLKERKPN